MHLVRALLLAVISVALLVGCAGKDAVDGTGAGQNRYQAGSGTTEEFPAGDRAKAPELTGETLEGESFDLADWKGQVIVINFWASWCAPCRLEAPELEAVYQETKEAGVAFLGIDIRDGRDAALAFQDSFAVTYPSLFDPAGKVALSFREVPPNTIPATIILDREGRVAVVLRKGVLREELAPLVTDLAAED